MADRGWVATLTADGQSDEVEVVLHEVSIEDGIAYSIGDTLHKVEVSSMICAENAFSLYSGSGGRGVVFLRDSRLFAIRGEQISDMVYKLDGSFTGDSRFLEHGHIIVSVLSGKCMAEKFYDETIVPLLSHFHLTEHYQVHKTSSSTSVIELAKNVLLPAASRGEQQHVILLSGDGGIVDIINELLTPGDLPVDYRPPLISLIPMGTGNALAHSTKVFDGTNGLASWLRGEPRDLPLIRATFSHDKEGAKLLSDEGRKKEDLFHTIPEESYFWGAVVFSWGFHAQIVADSDTPEYRKHGVERFSMAAKEALFPEDGSGPHKYHGLLTAQVQDDSNSFSWSKLGSDEHCYVLATLVSNLEATFTISPKSAPFNEDIRLVHIGHQSGEEIMRIMGLAYQGGKHIAEDAVDYKEVDGIQLAFKEDEERWRRVCIDGKIILVEKNGWVDIQREHRVAVRLTSLPEPPKKHASAESRERLLDSR